MDRAIVVSRRALITAGLIALVLAAGVALLVLPDQRGALAGMLSPRATADPALLGQQRAATEASIQRGYAKALAQLRQVRELRLAITQAEADRIETEARQALASIRTQALTAVGQRLGLIGPALEQYVVAAVARLDAGGAEGPATLLAPALFEVASQADLLFQQAADAATRQLTRAPSPSPSGSPAVPPTAAPVPTPTPRQASPSPTGR